MKVAVLKASETVFEGFVSEAILPSVGGQMSVLDDHEFFFAALAPGRLLLRLLPQTVAARPVFLRRTEAVAPAVEAFPINGGVARMKRNELVILVE